MKKILNGAIFTAVVATIFLISIPNQVKATEEPPKGDGYCGVCINDPRTVKITCHTIGTNTCIPTPCTMGFCDQPS